MIRQKHFQSIFLSMLFLISLFFTIATSTAEKPTVEIGGIIPDMEAYSIEGLPITLRPAAGKLRLLLFFSETNQEMLDSMYDAYVLYKRFSEHGLDAVAIWNDQAEDAIFTHAQRWQIPWPQVRNEDAEQNPFKTIGIETTPANLLIDSSGKIIAADVTGKSAHQIIAEKLGVSLDSLPMPESPTENPRARDLVSPNISISSIRPESTFEQRMGSPAEREEAEKCKENLRKISLAITDYQRDHNGELPNWLSDLYPNYLQDESILLCPNNPNPPTSFTNAVDPKMKCSYLFEFAPTEGLGRNYREWKTEQLSQFGDRVPVVICLNHPSRRLNLGYSGEIFFSSQGWEGDFPQGKTLNDPAVKVRKTFREMASAFAKYKKDHNGELPLELEELYPNYVSDRSLLRCPVTGSEYSYQFSLGSGYRETKLKQLEIFGGYVPVLRSRAVMDDEKIINLAYSGEIYSSDSVWERHFDGTEAYATSRMSAASTTQIPAKGLDVKIEGPLEARGIFLSEIIKIIGNKSELDIVLDRDADRQVTFNIHNATIREILEGILPPNRLDFIELGDGKVQIGKKENIQEIKRKVIPSKVARVTADLRSLATALECFFIDNNAYPVPENGNTLDSAVLTVDNRNITLLEPVRYILNLPNDPFAYQTGYRYFSDGKTFYILASNGPNGKIDLNLHEFNPRSGQLDQYTYNPTNGIDSPGDIFRVGP
ncbi:MAG: hypothetical protein C4527_28905 [Candidatus Omnitrophota bacterium]|nr:MAG: hypothetical protein C4527_28905 [Candidatus Omnitrophota bacterium]